MSDFAKKFNSDRASEYEEQSRIALAGYDACHELSACMLAAALGAGKSASILMGGAGGGAREIIMGRTPGALVPGGGLRPPAGHGQTCRTERRRSGERQRGEWNFLPPQGPPQQE